MFSWFRKKKLTTEMKIERLVSELSSEKYGKFSIESLQEAQYDLFLANRYIQNSKEWIESQIFLYEGKEYRAQAINIMAFFVEIHLFENKKSFFFSKSLRFLLDDFLKAFMNNKISLKDS